MDYLDSGSLKIQYNRNRYYDYYTGRWLTQDPLSYVDGINLYEYARSSPGVNTDPYGFMTDSEFAIKFIYHYFLGMGALWDKGADVLRRQESVKETIGQQLKFMAKSFCTEALYSGGFASGSFFKMLHGERKDEQVFANSSIFLKWTLNGAEYYIISGKYEAKACALECPCTVRLKDVEHTWGDMGDLNLSRDIGSHWPDWLVWFATRIGIPPAVVAHSLGLFAIDFQVSISWTENNFLWKPTVRDSFRDERGWPFWPYDSESSR
jgi:RHS repeat-associated protein